MDLLAGLKEHGNLTAYSQECIDFITEVSKPHLELLQQYLELSGHGINQIGSYDECMAVPNSSYYLCFAADPAPGFVGICIIQQSLRLQQGLHCHRHQIAITAVRSVQVHEGD